jgi:adenylate kinase
MKLVLIGIQGAGKSTQGNLLSKQLKIPYLSTGHIFREIAKEKTQLGRYVKELINSGVLIPDEKTIEIVNSYLSRPEYKNGYILDGFPRTTKQAKEFHNNVDKVIYLEIPDKESLWRLAYRKGEKREDNTIEAIRKRIELFHTHTEHVLDYYEKEGKLVALDGTQSIKEVNEEILKSLGKQLIRNQIHAWSQKNKSIIAIVGLSGSGKTEASTYFAKVKKIPVIAFGKTVMNEVKKRGLKQSEETQKIVREEIRSNYGLEAMAVLNKDTIAHALEKNVIIAIDGLYSWEEYTYLKKEFPKVNIYLLAMYTDKHIRYKRAAKRKDRPNQHGEERDINELIGLNKAPPIAFADFLVKNNFSVEELHDKLEDIYSTVYFL